MMFRTPVRPLTDLYIGLMSGTSLDGIDAALVDFGSGSPQLVAAHFEPMPDTLRADLLALQQPGENELHRASLAANALALAYARAVEELLAHSSGKRRAVAAIGCHGQTIRHQPDSGYTVQIGNAALLAELTAIPVVSDFRSRDVAAGGQGAPLVPAFHSGLFRDAQMHRVVVNIGGIANLTDLPPGDGTVTGFDSGPGNVLLDGWIARHRHAQYDANGDWATSGHVNQALLDRLLSEPYFNAPPPKSTGRDLFHLAWLDQQLSGLALPPEDIQATLLELTARSIAHATFQHCHAAEEVYLCGGGARNGALVQRLQALLAPLPVASTEALGLHPDWVEACAFAWLARQRLHHLPGNLPAVTGAKGECVLGAVHA